MAGASSWVQMATIIIDTMMCLALQSQLRCEVGPAVFLLVHVRGTKPSDHAPLPY